VGTVLIACALAFRFAKVHAENKFNDLEIAHIAYTARPYNVRVNTVAPRVIRTPLHAGTNVDDYAGIHPLNRVGEVEETTDAVVYLAHATYTTGVILAVDGGDRVGRR